MSNQESNDELKKRIFVVNNSKEEVKDKSSNAPSNMSVVGSTNSDIKNSTEKDIIDSMVKRKKEKNEADSNKLKGEADSNKLKGEADSNKLKREVDSDKLKNEADSNKLKKEADVSKLKEEADVSKLKENDNEIKKENDKEGKKENDNEIKKENDNENKMKKDFEEEKKKRNNWEESKKKTLSNEDQEELKEEKKNLVEEKENLEKEKKALEEEKEKKKEETIVVIPKTPKDFAPLGNPGLLDDKKESKEVEKIIIKDTDNGSKQKKIVETQKSPQNLAPLGTVNGLMGSSKADDPTASDYSKISKKSNENVQEPEKIADDKSETSKNASEEKPTFVMANASKQHPSNLKDANEEKKHNDQSTSSSNRIENNGSNNEVSNTKKDEENKDTDHVSFALFVPPKLEEIPRPCILPGMRERNAIKAEGFFFKQRPWFFCFWHKKYLVLSNTGQLMFIDENGKGQAQGNWNAKDSRAINKIDYPGATHPHRLTFSIDSTTLYFSFDCVRERNFWYETLQDISRH